MLKWIGGVAKKMIVLDDYFCPTALEVLLSFGKTTISGCF